MGNKIVRSCEVFQSRVWRCNRWVMPVPRYAYATRVSCYVHTTHTCVCIYVYALHSFRFVCIMCRPCTHMPVCGIIEVLYIWALVGRKILPHPRQDVKKKAWLPHNLHISFTHPITMDNCVDYVEMPHNSCTIGPMGVLLRQ